MNLSLLLEGIKSTSILEKKLLSTNQQILNLVVKKFVTYLVFNEKFKYRL